jgi:predicted enzyme related to lactoylglutathione lyase
MSNHHKMNYIEFPAKNMYETKMFFANAFNWTFQDYGMEYCAITNAGIDGGFYKSDLVSKTENGSVLIVLYSDCLKDSEKAIVEAEGSIIKPIFEFPGGQRFHFCDPNGNEFAAWSDK